MNNIVKLVQANGKGLVVDASAITIVRTLEPKERDKNPNGRSGVWLTLGGTAQHAVVRESFGFILRKAGGDTTQRVQLAGLGDTRISMPRGLFGHAIESERVEKSENGAEPIREDATIVQTTLHSSSGPVAFYARDSAEAIFDLIATEASEDDGADEEEEEDAPNAAPKPKARRAAKAAA